MRHLITSLALLTLAACGGGGGGSSSTTISGKVIDGYISGAKVCLDLNNNFICDAGEPFTTSDATGAYSFSYSGSIAGKQVLAIVDTNAIDLDLGPITTPYSLLAPAEHSTAITPISTLVSHEMITSHSSVEEASAVIKTEFNLTQEPLDYDFKANSDSSTTKVAQTIAAAIAVVNDTLSNDATASSSLNVGERMKAAVKEARETVLPTMIKNDGTVASLSCGSTCKQIDVVANLRTSASDSLITVQGKIQSIVSNTKAGDGTIANIKSIFEKGMVTAQIGSGDYIDANGNRVDGSYGGYIDSFEVEFTKLANNTFIGIFKVLVDKNWFTTFNTENRVTFWDGSNWTKTDFPVEEFIAGSQNPTFSGNCMTTKLYSDTKEIQKFCVVEKDVSSKKLEDIFPKFCTDANGKTIKTCNPNAVLPSGSSGYEFGTTIIQSFYQLYGWSNGSGYAYQGAYDTPRSQPSVDLFIEYLKTNYQTRGDSCNTGFMINRVINSTSGEIKWGLNSSSSCDQISIPSYTEITNYEINTVGGKQIMVVDVPSLYRIKNPGDMLPGCKFVFGVVENPQNIEGVFSGDFCKAGVNSKSPFNGDMSIDSQSMSKILYEFLTVQIGAPAFPYPQ